MGSPGGNPNNSGRVTNRELYEALMKQNKERNDLERRLMAELKCLPRIEQQVTINKDEIDKLRARSNLYDVGLGLFTVVATVLGNVFGTNRQ